LALANAAEPALIVIFQADDAIYLFNIELIRLTRLYGLTLFYTEWRTVS
jgi:hypothetical protein